MKPVTVLAVSAMVGIFAFAGGYSARTVLAQQAPASAATAAKLPPDVHPDTGSRMPLATRDEFTTDEDLKAFDTAVAAAPDMVKPGYSDPGNRIRLHVPVVHIAYRDTIQNLNRKNNLEAHYAQLATLIACREMNEEYDWLNHEKQSAGKSIPRETIEIVRNKQDTKSLPEKDQVLIEYGREIFRTPKVTSKTYADMERLFGRRGTLAMTLIMAHYTDNSILYRAYDQQIDPVEFGGVSRPFPDVLAREAKGQ